MGGMAGPVQLDLLVVDREVDAVIEGFLDDIGPGLAVGLVGCQTRVHLLTGRLGRLRRGRQRMDKW